MLWNFLGMELRPPLVADANAWAASHGLRGSCVHFVAANANVALRALLGATPPTLVRRVAIQFPDPWAKACHRKRRIVQRGLVADLAAVMAPASACAAAKPNALPPCEVFVSCDYEELFQDMVRAFEESEGCEGCEPGKAAFVRQEGRDEPLGMPSERETLCKLKGRTVYRAWFTRAG